MGTTPRVRARPDVEIRIVGREAILHDPVARRTHVVNTTAARVWELCDGRDVAELVNTFAAGYGRRPDDVRADVEQILGQFDRLGLLE